MLKKIAGTALLLVAAVLALFAVQRASHAPTVLYAVGAFLPSVLCGLLGWFCWQKPPAPAEPPSASS